MNPVRTALYGLYTLDEINKILGDDDVVDLSAVKRIASFAIGSYNGEAKGVQVSCFAELGGSVVVVARSD